MERHVAGPLIVLVTGCSSGFGKLIAQTLARRGHTVFASMRGCDGKNAQAAKELNEWTIKEGVKLHVIDLDVTDDSSVDKAVREIISSCGRIDVVVNNAGILAIGPDEGFTPEQARAIFEVNLIGPHRVNRAVLPYMRRQRSGLIVQISSSAARLPVPYSGLYDASKAATDILAEAYRYELAPFGVDSVIVEPDLYPTRLFENMMAPGDVERLGDYGGPERQEDEANGNLDVFGGPDAPDPRNVVDAVVRLIEAPAGERPLRTAVSDDHEALAALEAVNAASDRAMARILESMGMGKSSK